ncbi:L,D-transpeptidase family protein [Nocardioides alkalitolerans]|uniref:L,D-transpeptidase family protein n=1 Tax=Nocardioides alkalitolerans TaxID=281714 RepID=UPI0003FD6923|nr:L,D-transpeptidase family protein [Nocardioides alkalitolerans]
MKILRTTLLVLLTLGLVASATYGVVRVAERTGDGEPTAGVADSPSPVGHEPTNDAPASPTDEPTDEPSAAPTEEPTEEPTAEPTLEPGPAIYSAGDSGDEVRDLQARLVQIDWLTEVSGTYDDTTVAAVEGFQGKRAFPVTGEVDDRTLTRLHEMTGPPTYEEMHNIAPVAGDLDPRCREGRVLCIDKTTRTLRWVVDGDVGATFDVRFGREGMETREGAFSVERKSRDHVSSIYDTPMPFAMFFSGGQAVHYSPDFAANGYNGASHGCVNVRDRDGIEALFDQVEVGDSVVVYWS